MYPLTCLRSASDSCNPSRTEEFAPIQFKTLYTTHLVTAQAQSAFWPVTWFHINSAMPLEGFDAYTSDCGSSIDSSDAADVPKTPKYDTNANGTEAGSNDERSGARKFGNLIRAQSLGLV
jgi:hypothetical protein